MVKAEWYIGRLKLSGQSGDRNYSLRPGIRIHQVFEPSEKQKQGGLPSRSAMYGGDAVSYECDECDEDVLCVVVCVMCDMRILSQCQFMSLQCVLCMVYGVI